MKKLIAILILCFITGIATVNAAYQRKQKQPNFFIPTKAISNTVDNIPTTEQVIMQQNRRLKLMQQKAGKNQNLTANNAKSKSTKQHTHKFVEITKQNEQKAQELPAHPQPQEANLKTTAKVPEQKPTATQTAVSKTDLTSKPLPQHTDEIKPEVPQENIEPGKDFTPIDYSDIDKAYEQTFIDYQNDLAAIKNKTPIDNPRLIKMQEDFQNIEHSLKAD